MTILEIHENHYATKSVCQVQQLCPFGNLGLAQNPCDWVLYYRDDPLDPWKFGHSPKFLAIGSHSTEMIPLIQWPWIAAESMQPHNHFGKAAGPNYQAFALYLWHTDAWVVRYWVWLYLGASWGKQCTQAHTKRKHIKAIALISSVIWVVHFILFCPSTKQWPTL